MRVQGSGFRVQRNAAGFSARPVVVAPSPTHPLSPSPTRYTCRATFAFTAAVALLLALAGCGEERGGPKPEKIIGNQGVGPGEFVNPRAVAVGPDGCVYVIDKTARVQRFSADGEYQLGWRMPEWQSGKPTGVMVDAQNRVWVADTHYFRVMVYDRDGHELERFGTKGEGAGEFIFPTDIALAPDGTRYVSEYGGHDRISRFSAKWEYLGSFGGQEDGPAALRRPQTMALDPDGTLWVADSGNHRVCHFSADGKLLGSFGGMGSGPGEFKFPYGLALCPDGTMLVSEFENNRVQRVDKTGKCLAIWGGPGTQPGEFAEMWGVAVGKDGRFYVADCKNHRVQMFRM